MTRLVQDGDLLTHKIMQVTSAPRHGQVSRTRHGTYARGHGQDQTPDRPGRASTAPTAEPASTNKGATPSPDHVTATPSAGHRQRSDQGRATPDQTDTPRPVRQKVDPLVRLSCHGSILLEHRYRRGGTEAGNGLIELRRGVSCSCRSSDIGRW